MKADYKGATFRKSSAAYKQTYRLSKRRPWYRRLTPLSWFCLALMGAGVIAFASMAVNAALQNAQEQVPLAAVVGAQPNVMATSASLEIAAESAPATVVPTTSPTTAPTAMPTTQPTVVPTPLPTVASVSALAGASWAFELKKMPDGTLGAPAFVVESAIADLREWMVLNQTMDAGLFIKDHEHILGQYFAEDALSEQLDQFDAGQFTVNREGRYTLEVKDFSADGLQAKAGLVLRGRIDSVINTRNGKPVTSGKAMKDTLTLMTIQYDIANRRWKIIRVDDVIELS